MITGKADCGMQYGVKRSGSSVAYCALSIKCGTRDEEGYHSGIAHFVEHTIFKGTAKRSAAVINGYLDRLGGELNAFTTKEEIVLHATVLKEDMAKAAALLFELATCPTFPDQEINTEKGVVIDEIQSYKDSPSEDIYDKFEEMLFKGHPLSGNILGTKASVRKINRTELLKFVQDKFRPEKMAFTIVADIDEKSMEKSILKLTQKHFPDYVTSQETAASEEAAAFVSEPFDLTLSKRNHQANCIIGGLAPSLYQDRERLATVLLCNILGGPANNSILNSVLREKNGWVYGVECSYTQYSDTGIVAISLGCDKNNLEKCVKAVYKEIDKLQEVMFSERKLKAAKKQLLGQMAISGDNGETQCLSMGKGLLAYGKLNTGKETRQMVEGITAEDIREMARTIFAPSNLSKLIYI
jgi:predicted Zn-dependent peptidase